MIADIAEILDQFRRETMPATHQAINQHIADYPASFRQMARLRYLEDVLEDLVLETLDMRIAIYEARDETNRLYLEAELFDKTAEISKYNMKIASFRRPRKAHVGITNHDIGRAREVPCNKLVEVNRTNMALCPFHDDRTPSMRWYRDSNRLYCFSCNRGWDTISFLRERDGLSFVQAVKELC